MVDDQLPVAASAGMSELGPPTRLWPGDELAATALYSTDPSAVVAYVSALTANLVGADASRARVELLSSSLAVAKAQESALSGLFATLTRKKDLRSALEVGRLLKQASERVARLAEAHAGATRPRSVIVAVSADAVGVKVGV